MKLSEVDASLDSSLSRKLSKKALDNIILRLGDDLGRHTFSNLHEPIFRSLYIELLLR